MSSNNTFKLILISVIFPLSVLIALPYIPLYVDSSLLRIDTQIGGYEIKIPQKNGEKIINFSNFVKGKGFGENQKIIFSLVDKNIENKEEVLKSIVSISEKRLNLIGISEFEIGMDDADSFFVLIPEYESSDRLTSMVLGTGRVDFKKIKSPEEWSQEQFVSFYTEIDRWESVGINESDFIGFIYSNPPGAKSAVLQISFTTEGRAKFYEIAKNNINLPIGIYLNDFEYPYLMPVLAEGILDDPNSDPAVTGDFSQKDVNDLNVQLKNPLPAKISLDESLKVASLAGNNFYNTYLYAFFIGLIGIFIFFTIKFNVFGSLYILSFIFSFPVYLAFAKILPIPISSPLVVSLILITGITSSIALIAFRDIKTGVSQGKPFSIMFYQIFVKEKEKMAIPPIFIFVLSLFMSFILSGVAKFFMTAVSVAMLVVIYFYSFILPTFVEVFGGHKK